MAAKSVICVTIAASYVRPQNQKSPTFAQYWQEFSISIEPA